MTSDLAAFDQERFYSIEEAAEELGKSASTIRRMVKQGRLQAVQARIAQGYEWRIRLRPEDRTPNPPALTIRQPLSLEETRQAITDALSTIAEELAFTRRQVVEVERENARLTTELEAAQERLRAPWWRRWFAP